MKGHLQAPQAGHGGAELGPSGGALIHGGVLHQHGPHPLGHSAAAAGGQEPAVEGGRGRSGAARAWGGSSGGRGRAEGVKGGGMGASPPAPHHMDVSTWRALERTGR